MEIIKKMNIPASVFYDQVMDSVLFDIRKHTGKNLTRKQLNNFEYVKEFSKNSRARIKVEKLVENTSYHFRTSTIKNDFLVQYDIKPLDEKSCEIRYNEKMESYGFLQKMNDAVLGTILLFFKKRQFTRMLKMMEESY